MRTGLFLLCCLLFSPANAQENALHNAGNLRIHADGQIGFHTNLINNSTFDSNLGLAGFYADGEQRISGAFSPQFFNMEILKTGNLFLETSTLAENSMLFALGNIVGPKINSNIRMDFLENTFITGENNGSHVNGYVGITNQANFSFPIGDGEQLRPLILNSGETNIFAACAYFFENANDPITLDDEFNILQSENTIDLVSDTEFWVLEGEQNSTISLSWNERSNIANLTNDINDIVIVGWSRSEQQWLNLGQASIGGDINFGFVRSDDFIPNDFSALTFGIAPSLNDSFANNNRTLGNFYVSPNGDGINDRLIIDQLINDSPNNSLAIFNRFGQPIFSQENYVDEFEGFSNENNLVIARDNSLPEGVYFYVTELFDLGLSFQGFLFLEN